MARVMMLPPPSRGERSIGLLYDEHGRAVFPARLRDGDVAGVDLVVLDADIAGCVTTWLSGDGRLDAARLALLSNGVGQLARVLPLLTDAQEARYFDRLRQLAQLVFGGGQLSREPERGHAGRPLAASRSHRVPVQLDGSARGGSWATPSPGR
jgi:hypothetical protein